MTEFSNIYDEPRFFWVGMKRDTYSINQELYYGLFARMICRSQFGINYKVTFGDKKCLELRREL